MHRLLQTLILGVFLTLMHAAWQPANAATHCEGLECAQCEVGLNTALASNLVMNTPYAFVCGHDARGTLFVAFSQFLDAPPTIYSAFDGFFTMCHVNSTEPDANVFTETPLTDRKSINAWKKALREVCRNY